MVIQRIWETKKLSLRSGSEQCLFVITIIISIFLFEMIKKFNERIEIHNLKTESKNTGTDKSKAFY